VIAKIIAKVIAKIITKVIAKLEYFDDQKKKKIRNIK
jgi:hypothetical protein